MMDFIIYVYFTAGDYFISNIIDEKSNNLYTPDVISNLIFIRDSASIKDKENNTYFSILIANVPKKKKKLFLYT